MQYGIPLVPMSKDKIYFALLSFPPHLLRANTSKSVSKKVKIVHIKQGQFTRLKFSHQDHIIMLSTNLISNISHNSYCFGKLWAVIYSSGKVVKLSGYLICMESLFPSSHLFHSFSFRGLKVWGNDGKDPTSSLNPEGGMGPGVRCHGFKLRHPTKLPDLGKRLNSLSFGFLMSIMGCVADWNEIKHGSVLPSAWPRTDAQSILVDILIKILIVFTINEEAHHWL